MIGKQGFPVDNLFLTHSLSPKSLPILNFDDFPAASLQVEKKGII